MKLQPVSDMRHWLLYSTNYIPNFILFTPSQTSAISQVTSHWGIVSHKHRPWDRLKRLAGLKKLILEDGPGKMTRKVWTETK